MELPLWKPIDPARLPLLAPAGEKIMEAWDTAGPIAFACPGLTTLNGASLLLPLEQERTEAGRSLVRTLWFGGEVTVWFPGDGETWIVIAQPWRCHIAGPVFRQMLDRVRKADPRGDIAAVWELEPLAWERTAQTPPQPQELHLLSEAEHHLELL